jgi:hypothetical protein
MSQDTGVTPTASPTEQQMVPKERLDELIAERRRLEEQVALSQQLLRQAVPSQRVAPAQEEPQWLKQMKEENPSYYQAYKKQEMELKQVRAASFIQMDQTDRIQFVTEFGDEAKKRLPEVEAKLDELRRQGVTNYNRGQIFIHLLGQDRWTDIRAPKAPVQQAPVVPAQQTPNVPSQNPSVASTTASSAAAAAPTKESLEEMEQRLANMVL